MFAAEDGYEDVVLPSLIAEGADLSKVFHIPYVIKDTQGKKDRVHFGIEHLSMLAAELKTRPDVKMIVIDPIASFVGKHKVDEHKAAELRRVLDPLSDLAEATGVAILILAHVNKASGARAIYRVAGSAAYVSAVRLAYLLAEDPDDTDRRLMMVGKTNLTIERSAIAFRLKKLTLLEAMPFRDNPKLAALEEVDFVQVVKQMARLEFDDPVDVDPNCVMGDGKKFAEKKQSCEEWLECRLGTKYSWYDKEIEADALLNGYSKGRYGRAKTALAPKGLRRRPSVARGPWLIAMGDPTRLPLRPDPHANAHETAESAETAKTAETDDTVEIDLVGTILDLLPVTDSGMTADDLLDEWEAQEKGRKPSKSQLLAALAAGTIRQMWLQFGSDENDPATTWRTGRPAPGQSWQSQQS